MTYRCCEVVTETLTISGKRVSAKPSSLTDANGEWELALSGSNNKKFVVSIDGGAFSGGRERGDDDLNGSIVGNRVTATSGRFEFAAQKR